MLLDCRHLSSSMVRGEVGPFHSTVIASDWICSLTTRSLSTYRIEAHTQEYLDLMAAAQLLIDNEAIRFAFIHLPVPHPPGIYDRHTGKLGVQGTYLDNLVLADKAIGALLDTIGQTKAASRTIVVISSDHSWRIAMWRRGDPTWSEEEALASRGNSIRAPSSSSISQKTPAGISKFIAQV